MNTEKAHDLLCHAGELIQLVSRFQACYGRGYRVLPGSDAEAWHLLEAINAAQLRLALLLDVDPLEQAHSLNGCWWEAQDVPDVPTAHSLISQAGHLITACTYTGLYDSTTAVRATQRAIAGILHPSIRLIALERHTSQAAS